MGNATSVVAGIDGSADGRAAAEFAAQEADRRGMWLRLVHGAEQHSADRPVLPSDITGRTMPPTPVMEMGPGPAQPILEDIAADIRTRHQGLRVECAAVAGNPSAILVDESKAAGMLVLGSRGLGRFRSLLIGSVSEQVATHASGPVIVIRRSAAEPRPRDQSGPVLVGVDGSASSAQASGFAADEAASRSTSLIAVHVFDPPHNTRDQANQVLGDALADRLDEPAAVPVEQLVVDARNPTGALLDLSRERRACLVVAGSRGRGGFTGLLLGSVSRALLSHADRPVAIVHPPAAL